jgi:predicted DNA-binding transcriptional regulator AlpA
MAAVHKAIENLLNEHDVARITGLSVASVRRWRHLRQEPNYLKLGAAVRYRPEDISVWLESRPSAGGHGGAVNGGFDYV